MDTRPTCCLAHPMDSGGARSRESAGGVFFGNIDLIVLVRTGLPGDASETTQPGLCRANDPYRCPALTASASAVGANCGFQMLDHFGALSVGIGAQVQFDVVMQ